MMNRRKIPFTDRVTRRDFLKLGGGGALLTVLAGSGLARAAGRIQGGKAGAAAVPALLPDPPGSLPMVDERLVATDGFMSFPGRRIADDAGLYSFGFRGVLASETFASIGDLITKYKGFVQWPAPILGIAKDVELYLTTTNLGLVVRPDLDDSHTIHWHGFRNPTAIFDGVPEVSISIPVARDFPYFFRTRVEGTYMYHCHFEDVEHVQMGMNGVIYIKAANGRTYDGDSGSTDFHREFTLMLNEVDTRPHDMLRDVQEFVWSEYKPNYWVINGRSYPDTLIRDQDMPGSDFDFGDADLGYSQPVSSLIQLEEGETGLLRLVNMGYQQQSMQLLGMPMMVVGHDATYLGSQSYMTSSIYIGPGEARDVLFTAPTYSASLDGGTDGAGRAFNRYWLRNRNAHRNVNGILSGLGGQVTQVWVYPTGTLPAQSGPNKTL
jgi:FtsP/CotA-like multicopper oxidase with cupredoxin domain